MGDRFNFFIARLRERLWAKPLAICFLSIAGVFLAKMADNLSISIQVPDITLASIKTLLTIISSSMLVIATFAVASMVSAYSSASSTATPRTFPLVIADDNSQNALSVFIGAFIFSIVALITLENGYFDRTGRFALFALTLITFSIVILAFVRWIDRIARLGRLGSTIDKVEQATLTSMKKRCDAPHLGGVPMTMRQQGGVGVIGVSIGYVQRIDLSMLQSYAQELDFRIRVNALPGTFSAPGRSLATVFAAAGPLPAIDTTLIAQAFIVGNDRTLDEDPRFGLIILSEIGSRALSPAVNDPGTAIDIIGTLVRLFALWVKPINDADIRPAEYDRVEVPALSLDDMFDDAFTGIARDGAGALEVVVRLQKAFNSLASLENEDLLKASTHHARLALARAERTLALPEDLDIARNSAKLVTGINENEY